MSKWDVVERDYDHRGAGADGAIDMKIVQNLQAANKLAIGFLKKEKKNGKRYDRGRALLKKSLKKKSRVLTMSQIEGGKF